MGLQLLGKILTDPLGDHATAVAKQELGVLLDAHVAGLFAVAESIDFKKPLWAGALAKSKAAAYHTWLFHLLGCMAAGLGHQKIPFGI